MLFDYTGFAFLDKYHNHLVTSIFKTIIKNELREHFCKGRNYC